MKDSRPVNLDLSKFHFPLPALVSIGHRISGIVLFFGMPFLIWALSLSLQSNGQFVLIARFLSFGGIQVLLWLYCCALVYHCCAGVRHLFMDFGFGETIESARYAAIGTLVTFVILSLAIGVWLW